MNLTISIGHTQLKVPFYVNKNNKLNMFLLLVYNVSSLTVSSAYVGYFVVPKSSLVSELFAICRTLNAVS